MNPQYALDSPTLPHSASQHFHSRPNYPSHPSQSSTTLPHSLPSAPAPSAALAVDPSVYVTSAVTPTTPLTPLTPRTPNTSHLFAASSAGAYHTITSQASLQEAYLDTTAVFSAPGSMMPPLTAAPAALSTVASTPPQGHLPLSLPPGPGPGLLEQSPQLSSGEFDSSHIFPSPSHTLDPEAQPTHVVGSQGRRGILPSAPGRAAATVNGSASGKGAVIPAKDADGKFPCPHCHKTYLHAKHLKRHLLRHTGDRPYQCVLCRDTFSRSDILKRHFQKCSLRRGNPTGAGHLSHSQAHLRKPAGGLPELAAANVDETELLSSYEGADGLTTTAPAPAPAPAMYDPGAGGDQASFTDESAPASTVASRRNSLKRPISGGTGRDRRSLTGPGPSGSNRASFDGSHLNGQGLDLSAALDQIHPPLSGLRALDQHPMPYRASYDFTSHPPDTSALNNGRLGGGLGVLNLSRGLGYSNGVQEGPSHEIDWAQLLPTDPPAGLTNPLFDPHMGLGPVSLKTEPPPGGGSFPSSTDAHEGWFHGLYPSSNTSAGDASSVTEGLATWQLDMAKTDPLQDKADQLVCYCFPDTVTPGSEEWRQREETRGFLTVDTLRDCVRLFSNFQSHWPMIHMPTFSVMDAYEGLLLTMICIGAVYSDRWSVGQVRTLLERCRSATERTSPLFRAVAIGWEDGAGWDGTDANANANAVGAPTEIEQIQAFTMMQILFTWHGEQEQRRMARHTFPHVVAMARRAGLGRPVGTGHAAYSVFHQADLNLELHTAAPFDWLPWVEQEKRVRIMYNIYLLDTALVIYFNNSPLYESFEIRNPLPSDDAAWEAPTASDCADALGLHGLVAQAKNDTGSRRVKQPEMHLALKALLHPTYELTPRSTNVCSKFVLIHALHVQLWTTQKQLAQAGAGAGAGAGASDVSRPGSGTSTPLVPNDWISDAVPGTVEVPGTAMSTPQQKLKAITNALAKWKKAWDEDMATQYPSAALASRRVGFGRDGVPFYWLARAFLRNSRVLDWQVPADQRVVQVFSLLRKVKQWVASDSAQRGEEMGAVGAIDDSYGVDELALDMKLLFTPISERLDSPVNAVPVKAMPGRVGSIF
ncbi:MAG: hypothetical protein M1838_000187 [Thelocarpon superellum]|nr:MAG: hypothetical protein M1838_000187 [Thelocarpon superellum]